MITTLLIIILATIFIVAVTIIAAKIPLVKIVLLEKHVMNYSTRISPICVSKMICRIQMMTNNKLMYNQ